MREVALHRPGLEALESRRFLDGEAFAVNINFQPSGYSPPSGYVADTGAAFDDRGNGYSYGWSSDNTTEAPKLRHTRFTFRYDSMVYTFGKTWEIAVPNGTYRVWVVSGDYVTAGRRYAVCAEGATVYRGSVSDRIPYIGGQVDVQVTDGRLTLWARSDAPLTPFNFARFEKIGEIDSPEPPVSPSTGRWATLTSVPAALGEVSGGVINNRLYIVGDGDSRTFSYDFATNTWSASHATRPVRAKDQVAEVVDGKLYLFGGVRYLSSGQQVLNTTQIYDPSTNRWTYGASIPFAAAASQTAVIGGKIYLAGGVTTGNITTNRFAVYDPTTNRWTNLPDIPHRTDSGATGTDGRRMFIFGGRDVGDRPGNGYAQTLVYDTRTNTWTSSRTSSTYAPLPQRRAGVSKAPFLNGEFYVIGGETDSDLSQTGADGVYDRVDVYNPLTNTWRQAAPIPTDRHGIAPVAYNGKIYVAGGGVVQGKSESRVFEVFTP